MIQTNILIAFLLNLGFALLELLGGLWTGSVAILSDSLHDLIDALTIGLSYWLEKKSHRPADTCYTYGYRRFSVLGALLGSFILAVGAVATIGAALQRLAHPTSLDSGGMIVVALVGVVVNYFAFVRTHTHDHSLNQKAVHLHMLEDMAGWLVVLVGSLVIRLTGVTWVDPVMSLGISGYLLWEVSKNILEISHIFLLKSPQAVGEIIRELEQLEGIEGVHHVHLWSLDGEKNLFTAHITGDPQVKSAVKQKLSSLGVEHSVLEFEALGENCQDITC